MSEFKVPPQDVEIEKAILSALMLEPDKIDYAIANLRPNYFYKSAHTEIYKTILHLYDHNESVDLLSVTSKLKSASALKRAGGAAYLSEVYNAAASSVDIESHIKIIAQKAVARNLISEVSQLLDDLYDGSDILPRQEKINSLIDLSQRDVINNESLLRKYEALRITSESDVPEIIPYVKIGDAVICTPENITAISGESKASKSALANVILAGAIYQDEERAESFKHLTIKKNESHKAVLHFDTEQSRTIHKARHQGILNRAGLANDDPEYYYSYNIRKLNITDYSQVTSDLCRAAADKHHGIHLIVIDGIADYILSVNDEESANEIVHFFEQLAVEYQCPIITIIHLNPNSDNKQRGHLGSQLQRKAESVLIVKKDKTSGISWIEPQFLRNAGNENVLQIQFRYDPDKQYHVFAGIKVNEKSSEIDKLRYYAQEIFQNKGSISRKAAIKEIMELSGKGSRSSEDRLRDLEKLEFIERENPKSKSAFYVFKNI